MLQRKHKPGDENGNKKQMTEQTQEGPPFRSTAVFVTQMISGDRTSVYTFIPWCTFGTGCNAVISGAVWVCSVSCGLLTGRCRFSGNSDIADRATRRFTCSGNISARSFPGLTGECPGRGIPGVDFSGSVIFDGAGIGLRSRIRFPVFSGSAGTVRVGSHVVARAVSAS